MARKVLVAGGTGLVGSEILRLLAQDDDVAEIRALVRRPIEEPFPPKTRAIVADFNALESGAEVFRVQQVFCALGTTIKTAGSQTAFRRVDFDYPLAIARRARSEGASHFLLVSAIGADARSRIFYSRVKGELEDAVTNLGYTAVTIARPSVLFGPRKELRAGELVMKRLGFLLPPVWKPVQGRQVAAALVEAARAGRPGVEILNNAALRRAGA